MKHDVNMALLQDSLLLGGTNSTSLSIIDHILTLLVKDKGGISPCDDIFRNRSLALTIFIVGDICVS